MVTGHAIAFPLFYKDIVPLSRQEHETWRHRDVPGYKHLVGEQVVPLTADEFRTAQRHYPIVFSNAESPFPLALMGLTEGVNAFVEADGALRRPIYVPAYVRRYPFMMARLREDTEELSLCFDPTSDALGPFDDGAPLFDGEAITKDCSEVLAFCEQFEIAVAKTADFVTELNRHGLLVAGALNLKSEDGAENTSVRGFQMVDRERLRALAPDVLESWNRSGLLPLIQAHLFSLELARQLI